MFIVVTNNYFCISISILDKKFGMILSPGNIFLLSKALETNRKLFQASSLVIDVWIIFTVVLAFTPIPRSLPHPITYIYMQKKTKNV